MKRTVQKALAGLLTLSLFGLLGCKKESILPPTVKVFDGAIMVSYTSARVAAEVTDQGGAEVKSRGFVFGLSGGSSSLDTIFCEGALGVYSAEIDNLLPNTTYVYEAIARNAGGTGSSGKVSFTTQDISMATVKTGEVTEVTTTTALCGGEVTNEGGALVSERGVCLSTEHNPGINHMRFAMGQGLGAFSVETTGLLSNTTYYVRAYAINAKGVAYGEEKSFDTDAEPEQNYTISVAASPSGGGTVSGGGTYQEGQSCTVEAVAKPGYTFTKWTENGNEASTSANYTFNVTGNRTLVANFIADTPNSYTISVAANPTNGGTVTGGGTFEQGQSCTVNATAASGYSFVNWTENGNEVSSRDSFTFNVTANRSLVANFVAISYTIGISASPTAGGSVSGGGSYTYGQSCSVHATANMNYIFSNWTENGSVVSNNAIYTFTVNSNRVLVANFTYNGGSGGAPQGAINGKFTINANGGKVYFSQGNLQYQASTQTWRFASNQYELVGSANSNISQTNSGWIDLFGWGTSGWNCGNTYYRPWDSNTSNAGLYGPVGNNNLTGNYANSDWGVYNQITADGMTTISQWRTLTQSEWNYVLNQRSTTSGRRYAKARVNGVNGVILLPDNWSVSTYSLGNTNTNGASFNSNVISAAQWTILENAGAVFLPAAGGRNGTMVSYVYSYGGYWSASYKNSLDAYGVFFNDSELNSSSDSYRYVGHSVRLVCPVEN